jgi:predicted GH43/DUF377 family glycosyl hydrolase
MSIFPKKYVYPLITPQKIFRDNFNNANAYVDMNPTLNITSDGDVTILVRKVNYLKFSNQDFTLYDSLYSYSIYSMITCKMNSNSQIDLDNADYKEVEYKFNIPTYYAYWKGLEDIRFVNNNKIIAIIPECNSAGNPSIFSAELNNNIIESFIPCKPDIIEKNWMPFIDKEGNEKVIYKLSPFTIKSLYTEDFETISLPTHIEEALNGYHGSTNGVKYRNSLLFLIHINKERTYHRWLLLNSETNQVNLSQEFIFFQKSYIEFPCSLCNYKDHIFISLGVNDNKAFLLELNTQDIDNILIL